MHDFIKALETMDWDRFSSLLADDARFWTHADSGQWAQSEMKGRATILDRMKPLMSGLKDPTLAVTREEALGNVVIHERRETFTTEQGPTEGEITAMFLVHRGRVQVWFELVGALPA